MADAMIGRDLLERCRRGEREAFVELVDGTYRQVYTLAVRLVGDRHEAEDVAQEAYLRVHRSLRTFRGDSSFQTWLYRIVANTAMTHLRKRGRFGDLADEPETVLRLADSRPPEGEVDTDHVRVALNALPDAQRVILLMKDAYGFSCREIADEMGVSEGAVKVRLHRARRRLKDSLYGQAQGGHRQVRDRLPEYVERGPDG
ncbi:MAG TPA: sigma-70 family RNA polymerase sigma factor [Actinomycetota bacterium]|jgi:RNA polymerase sigma-70 factor (ECF subfamily)|nr:sigma-70 family RNA polymerase sigma factor [Actinomycetota bacterium]